MGRRASLVLLGMLAIGAYIVANAHGQMRKGIVLAKISLGAELMLLGKSEKQYDEKTKKFASGRGASKERQNAGFKFKFNFFIFDDSSYNCPPSPFPPPSPLRKYT